MKKLSLILIGGIPGSGKSTVARKFNLPIFEADQYFVTVDKFGDSNYKFDSFAIKDAHESCYNNVKNCLMNYVSCVVANTFIKRWEIERYFDLKLLETYIKAEINIKFYRCINNFGSIHNVPDYIVKRMINDMEHIEGEIIINNPKEQKNDSRNK